MGQILRCAVRLPADAFRNVKRHLDDATKHLHEHLATVGIHAEQGEQRKIEYTGAPGDDTLAQAMTDHEFGTDRLPERSWLRSFFDASHDTFLRGMRSAMRSEFMGDMSGVAGWVRRIADEWIGWIEDGGDFAPLSVRTMLAKEEAGLDEPDSPLVATRQFVRAFRARLDGGDV